MGCSSPELFGYEKGAFTGAHRRTPGQFEYANKGALYLDESVKLPWRTLEWRTRIRHRGGHSCPVNTTRSIPRKS